jgi:hypothetical protein
MFYVDWASFLVQGFFLAKEVRQVIGFGLKAPGERLASSSVYRFLLPGERFKAKGERLQASVDLAWLFMKAKGRS